MPALYGFTSNANVAVTDTTGLYQLTSNIGVVQSSYGNAQVAAYLPTYTGNVSSAGLGLTGIFTDHYYYANGAPFIGGGGTGTYGNSNVASYLTTSTGNIQAGNITVLGNLYVRGNTITTYTANTIASQIIANGAIPSTSTTTGALQSYGGLGVQGNINAGAVYTNSYFYANGASIFAGISGNYGNSNVAAYLSSGTVATITTTGNIKSYGNLIAPAFLYPNGVSILTGVTANYGNANVTALLAGTVNVGNLITTSGVYWSNGQPYSSGSSTSTYGNANVAAFLPHYGGTISAGTIFNASGLSIQGPDYAQIQWTNGAAVPASEYDVGVGSWFYVDAGGGIFQSNSTGNLRTITLGNDASLTAGGNVTAPYYIGNGSLLTNLPIQPGTYSNANVAAYLSSNTDPTISNLNANTQQQQAQINATNANIGSFYTYANVTYSTIANAASQQGQIDSINANVTASNAAIQTLSANLGSFETYANVTYSTIANAASQQGQINTLQGQVYSNANAASYLTVYTGNIQAGNVSILTDLSVGGNTIITGNLTVYGNTTTINSNVITTNDLNITVGNNQTTGAALNNAGIDVGSNNLATWRFNNASTSWQSNISITPQSNAVYNLGSPTLQWNTIYGRDIQAATATYTGNVVAGNVIATNLTNQYNFLQGEIDGANAAIITANTAMKAYVDAANTIQSNQINTINANVGAFETATNLSLAGANAAIATTNANIGSFYTYANATYSTIANAASQQGQIDAINANVTAANAAIVTANTAMKAYVDAGNTIQSNQINTINANIGAFETVTNIWLGNLQANVYSNANVTSYMSRYSAPIQFTVASSGNAQTFTNAVIGYYPTNQTMQLFHNGVLVPYSDYSIAGNILTVNEYLTAGDTLNVPPIVIASNVSSLVAGVSQIVAGTGVTISPAGGTGVVTINSSGGSGTYSNTNVAAYLPNYGGQIQSTNQFSNVFVKMQYSPTLPVSQDNIGLGNWAYLDAGGFVLQNNTAGRGYTSSFTYDLYGNLNIANGNIITTGGNVVASYFKGDGSLLTNIAVGTTYSNTNVTAYLAGTVSVGNISSTNGYFWANGVNYGSTVPGTYTNSNVTNLLTGGTYSGDINAPTGAVTAASITSTGALTAGNVSAGNVSIPYIAGTRNRGPLAIGGNLNHYDSGVVASFQGNEATYLYTSLQNTNTGNTAYSSYAVNDGTHTYYGELGINSGTYDYAAAGYPNNAFSLPYATFVQSTGANLAVGTYSNHAISFVVNGQTTTADAMTIANTGNVTVAGNLAVNTLATVGNIKSTSGYFWANGAVYSTGTGGGGSFSGNLLGNTLVDSVNNRILANASPLNSVSTSTLPSNGSSIATYQPVYTSGNLIATTASGVNQTIGMNVNGNVNLLTQFGAGNRTTGLLTSYLQVTATSANTIMNAGDRIRGTQTIMDMNLNSKQWGSMSTASAATSQIVGTSSQISLYGPGNVGHAIGATGTVAATAYQGQANVQYASSFFGFVNQAASTGSTASSIQYGRLIGGAISGQTGNVTMVNAVGLHTYSGWVSSNVSLVTNAYTVLNEDARSVISTVGNIAATGAVSSFGNLKVTGYVNPSLRYSNPSSGNVAISGGNMQSYQQISLGGNIGITAVATGLDTIYDFKIEQDATGSRTVTWYDASGAATSGNQIEGALNPIPFSATYARCIMSSTGLWTVAYGNPALQSYSNTSLNAATGSAGMMFAVSTNGNKPCYWDTTNSRWSYVFDNSAVA